jgi:hypothetical protein
MTPLQSVAIRPSIQYSMPDGSKHTFNTLARESAFRNPPSGSSTFPILNDFVAPHIESFNVLFDDSGLPFGDGDGRGLLSLAIKDIGERVVFDGSAQSASGGSRKGWGNKLSCKNPDSLYSSYSPLRINSSLDRTDLYRSTYGSRQRPACYRTQDIPCRGGLSHYISLLTYDLS